MGLVRQLLQRLPSKKTLDEIAQYHRLSPRLAFLRRRIRLKGSSTITMPLGMVLLFPFTIVMLLLVLFVRHPNSPGRMLMPSSGPPAIRRISEKYDKVFATGCLEPKTDGPRENAVIVVLARNKELPGVLQSLRHMERHFNRWFHYPYVFLNDGEFNDEFKNTVLNYTTSKVEFGQIDPLHWGFPDWADVDEVEEAIAKQGDQAIMYGGMASYHHMCRFYSGQFWKHELLLKYEWYWRLEPDIEFFCDMTYDPFVEMRKNNKTYGFTIAVKELRETVPNLFRYVSAYKRNNNITSKGMWEMFAEKREKKEDQDTLPEDVLKLEPGRGKFPEVDPTAMEGEDYNMCHFWSNFEIARFDFYRSKQYTDFFETLDRSGGFWTERWGDAPVHSLAAGVFLGPADLHYFRDIGYRHTTIQHCPANAPAKQLPRTPFKEPYLEDQKKAKEDDEYWDNWDAVQENGVGCRCKCDTDITDIEDKKGSCLSEWVKVAGGFTSP
ncbi:nucleotide-diphospho-sugar transferase [Tricharina praecox]|uniref:nucleotide-diphospho-sugar transferase n=1 Tax=Tricharina praecox TaxID=43433 RepID=UPI0022212495|nr:nucleotide-diphospho-sugar transferase [Tricharina praecox]KAI5845551.1 nucleotide-diphospho-sugar transferase [Tricharina praecox]